MKRILLLSLCAVGAANASAQALVSLYDFNNSLNPVVNATGNALALDFRTGGSGGTSTVSGGPSYSTATVGSISKQVASFTGPQFFRASHGMDANGGGAYVNQYSIVEDLNITDKPDGWASLFNTTADEGNDGDAFIDPNNSLGINGSYSGSFALNTWQRVVITVDEAAATPVMSLYVNGALQNTINLNDGLDGRWSLYGPFSSPTTWVDILGDNDGDNGSGQISLLGFYNGAMTASQAAALGGPGAVPEPATISILALGGLSVLRRRRRS